MSTLLERMTADAALLLRDGASVSVSIGGVVSAIQGEFHAEFASASPEGMSIETTGPAVIVASADVTGIVHNDTVTVATVVYYVTGIHPDGNGLTLLLLSRDNNQP